MLILILQLLERAGELAQRVFHAVEAHRQIAGIALRDLAPLALTLLGLTLLRGLLATAEQIVEEAGALVLRRRSAGQQQHGKRGERRDADSVS